MNGKSKKAVLVLSAVMACMLYSCGFYFFTPPPRVNPFDSEYNASTGTFSGTVALFGGFSPAFVSAKAVFTRTNAGLSVSGLEFSLTVGTEGAITGTVPLGTYDVALTYSPFYPQTISGKQLLDDGENSDLGTVTLTLTHLIAGGAGMKWGFDPGSDTVYYQFDSDGIKTESAVPGGAAPAVVTNQTINSEIKVSPDGRKLLFQVDVGPTETNLYMFDLDNSTAGKQLIKQFCNGSFAWNPDSRWIAITDESAAPWKIVEIDSTDPTSTRTVYTTGDITDENNSGQIIYSGTGGKTYTIIQDTSTEEFISVELNGSSWINAQVIGTDAFFPALGGRTSPYLYYRKIGTYEVWRTPVDGSSAAALFLNIEQDFSQIYISPSGAYLIYEISGIQSSYTVVATAAGGTGTAALPCPGSSYNGIAWNDDEDLISAIVTDASGGMPVANLYSIKMASGFTLP